MRCPPWRTAAARSSASTTRWSGRRWNGCRPASASRSARSSPAEEPDVIGAGPSAATACPSAPAEPDLVVRQVVRDLLLSSAAFRALDADQRRGAAQALVKVCRTAVALLRDEAESDVA